MPSAEAPDSPVGTLGSAGRAAADRRASRPSYARSETRTGGRDLPGFVVHQYVDRPATAGGAATRPSRRRAGIPTSPRGERSSRRSLDGGEADALLLQAHSVTVLMAQQQLVGGLLVGSQQRQVVGDGHGLPGPVRTVLQQRALVHKHAAGRRDEA